MPSDSIAGFLDQAQASRVLFPEQVEQLIRQPDIPQSNLDTLCAYLEQRGALTRFQADMLRQGRGYELNFAGYPVLDELGPCPGGVAYRALHPSLRTPVGLRRFRTEALLPTDNPTALIQRAREAATLQHPNLVSPLDAGVYRDESYATFDAPADAATLDTLVRNIGPMPGFLAAEYGRQIALALRAAHERGMWHGDIRPANLLIGPLTTKTAADGTVKRRPAPNAAVKVAEFGLVPLRPATAFPIDALPYVPPERLDGGTYDTRGDLYGLGATLYYLLAGRPPITGTTVDKLMHRVRASAPAPLTVLRPDVPAELAAVVHQLLAKQPDSRFVTASDVEAALAPFCRPGTVATAVPTDSIPTAVPESQLHPLATPADVPEAQPAPAAEWGTGEDFTTSDVSAGPVRRKLTAKEKARSKLLILLGLCLHLSAVALLVIWLTGVFNSSPEPEPVAPKKEPDKSTKSKKLRNT